MNKITLATIVALGLGAAACDMIPLTPQNRIAKAKALIEVSSDNPTTIKWGEITEFEGEVCGTFNEEQRYLGKTEWSGPQNFVTIKGEPQSVTNDFDCDSVVAPWSRCVNRGDEAKIKGDVESCKAYQAENIRQSAEQMDRFFKKDGLVQSGSWERDWETWEARMNQYDRGPDGYEDGNLAAKVEAGEVWDRAYNAEMRRLPSDATTEQKVAAAGPAVTAANAASEVFLTEKGYR
jgi:hypothetical protein